MKKKRKVVITTICACIITGIISFLGYYVFATESTEPEFHLTTVAAGNFAVNQIIEVNCQLDISTFYSNNEKENLSDWRIIFNNDKIVESIPKDENGYILNKDGIRINRYLYELNESGETIDSNNQVVVINDDGYRINDSGNKVDIDGEEIILNSNNDFIYKEGNSEVIVSEEKIGRIQKKEAYAIRDIASLTSGQVLYSDRLGPIKDVSQAVLNNKFIKTDLSFKLFFKAGENMVIDETLLDNISIQYKQNGVNKTKSLSDANTKTSNINVVVNNATASNIPNITANCTKVDPNPSLINEEVNVTYNLQAEDFVSPDAVMAGNETVFLIDTSDNYDDDNVRVQIMNAVFNKFTSAEIMKDSYRYGLVSFASTATSYITDTSNWGTPNLYLTNNANAMKNGPVNNLGNVFKQNSDNGDNNRDIVAAFTKATEVFDNAHDKMADPAYISENKCKNIVLVVSENFEFTAAEVTAIKALDLDFNLYTLQYTKNVIVPTATTHTNDNVTALHRALGGIDSNLIVTDNANDLQNIKMGKIAENVAIATPKKYTFEGFSLTCDLGDKIGKDMSPIDSSSNVVTISADVELVFTKIEYEDGVDADNNPIIRTKYQTMTNQNTLGITFPVYPKAIGIHPFRESRVNYENISGSLVANPIEPAVLTVVNPIEVLGHGLQNGANDDMYSIIKPSANIAGSTYATILAGATVYGTDHVKLIFDFDSAPDLVTKPNINLYITGKRINGEKYQFDNPLTSAQILDGEVNLPADMPRGSTVILRYTQFVPKSSLGNASYTNDVNYKRYISEGNPGNCDVTSSFRINEAELPDLF